MGAQFPIFIRLFVFFPVDFGLHWLDFNWEKVVYKNLKNLVSSHPYLFGGAVVIILGVVVLVSYFEPSMEEIEAAAKEQEEEEEEEGKDGAKQTVEDEIEKKNKWAEKEAAVSIESFVECNQNQRE